MQGLSNCPHCGVSLLGDPIPEAIRHNYGEATHWKREIGCEYPEKYDGIWEWMCPDCGKTWPSEVKLLRETKEEPNGM